MDEARYDRINNLSKEEFAQELTQVKTLRGMFDYYFVSKYRKGMAEREEKELADAFMAGAAAFMKLEHESIDDSSSDEEALEKLQELKLELTMHLLELKNSRHKKM